MVGKLKDKKILWCLKPKDEGFCHGYFGYSQRYYYNKESNECELFNYDGCGGNSNNFEAKSECERICKGISLLQIREIIDHNSLCSISRKLQF